MKKLVLAVALLFLVSIISSVNAQYPVIKNCCNCYDASTFLAACLQGAPIPPDACPTQVCFNGEPNERDWKEWSDQAREGYPNCPCIFVTPNPLPSSNPELCPPGEGIRNLDANNCRYITKPAWDEQTQKCVAGTFSQCAGTNEFCKTEHPNVKEKIVCGEFTTAGSTRINDACGCHVPSYTVPRTTAIPLPFPWIFSTDAENTIETTSVDPRYPAPGQNVNAYAALGLIGIAIIGLTAYFLSKKKTNNKKK